MTARTSSKRSTTPQRRAQAMAALAAIGLAEGVTAVNPPAAVPVNRWELRHLQAPNTVWENGIAWDPAARRIIWHGGHVGRLYNRFWTLWSKVNDQPLAGHEFILPAPADGPRNHYFYVRAVNILGQEGFLSDIVSPTDRRFRP